MDDAEAFVNKYKNQRFYDIYPVTIVLLVLAVFGIFGNFNIVWATIRKRSLRSRCNIMIAATAFSDLFHQGSHFSLAYDLFFGKTFITLRQCFWFQLIPVYCMNFGTFIVLSIGIDRLFSITCPVMYKQSNSKIYLLVTFMFPITYSFWLTFIAYSALSTYGNQPTFCLIASAYHDSVKDKWANITLLVNVLVILTYSAAWISTKFKSTKFERRIFRSLLVITSLVLFGWFTASLIFSLTIQLGWKAEKIVKTMMFAGTACINTSIALNYPVYAYFCREYRVAFVEQLRILTCRYRSSRTRPGISTIQVDGSNTSAHSTNRRNYEINSNVK